MQKFLIIFGIVLVALGLLWPLLGRIGLGQLPGDFSYRGEHVSFYVPLTTSLIVSIVLTLILWLLNR